MGPHAAERDVVPVESPYEGDVRASYGSVVANLQTTVKLAQAGLSRPGCWAYPDMLQVGCKLSARAARPILASPSPSRAPILARGIVSSPLTLSHDVNNVTITNEVWPIITNKEAIAINQAWAGHSGSPFKESEQTVTLAAWSEPLNGHHAMIEDEEDRGEDAEGTLLERSNVVAAWQYFYKPILPGGAKVAVLMMNHDKRTKDMSLSFKDVPGLTCTKCNVRDVWAKKDLGTFTDTYTAKGLVGHDAAFIRSRPREVAKYSVANDSAGGESTARERW